MSDRFIRQSFTAGSWLPDEANDIAPAAPWIFAVLLVGFAGALIFAAAVFPEFFAGSFNHFGPDTP